ncbi:hypothetical protein LSG31_17615 [Fodinisporobacter ferrooxydans]|uniref:Uncharacterized protein n=1 Tax=Fodinisporobacter ferrooxydans TaxID=2901836 RepID=A0ABY4CGN6_9BACL|nr:hypothetical protein LSG31_17615 [Alicyclobacillaceae bacterium MYW30-H2]
MSRIRIIPTLVVIVITLSILFGGWAVYKNFGLEHPAEQALKQVPSVQSVKVMISNQNRTVKVTVWNVQDLQSTYHKIKQVVLQSLGSDTQIQVVDTRSEALAHLYQTLQPVLYEGIHKGNYTEMIQTIESRAKQANVVANVSMDSANVYIQLTQDSHQLDDIIPYNNQQQGVNPS